MSAVHCLSGPSRLLLPLLLAGSGCAPVVSPESREQNTKPVQMAHGQEATNEDVPVAPVSPGPFPSRDAFPAGIQSVPGIVRWGRVPELPFELAIMESVFWEPDDTRSLRQAIVNDPAIAGAGVLEIGAGSGLIALCCLHAGAKHVVTTDLNPAAVANTLYNAGRHNWQDRIDVRLVPRRDSRAWTVIRPEERFDLIVSNPPWEDATPESVAQFALFDPGFELLQSIIEGAGDHLNPGGRLWLAYGCKTAIRKVEELAAAKKLVVQRLDKRVLDDLPELFLPGMLLELWPEEHGRDRKPPRSR